MLSLIFFTATAHAGTWTIYSGINNQTGSVTISSGPSPAIAFDATASTGVYAGTSPLTFSIPIGSGLLNRGIVVGCGVVNDTITGVTVGGNAINLATAAFDGGITRCYVYVGTGTASGSQAINVTTASGITSRSMCNAVSFANINQNFPVDVSSATYNRPGSGTNSVSLITLVGNDALYDVVNDENSQSFSPGSGQAQQYNSGPFNSFTVAASTKTAAGPSTYTMSWSAVSPPTVQCAIALQQSP